MSKFCGNCGELLHDEASMCPKCGAQFDVPEVIIPFGNTSEPVVELAEPAPQKTKPSVKLPKKINVNVGPVADSLKKNVKEAINGIKKGDKSSIIKVAVAALALLVVIVIVISVFSVPGYEKIAKKYIKAIEKDDPQAVVELLPKFYFEDEDDIFVIDEEGWEKYYESSFDTVKNIMDEYIGSEEFSIKWEIVDIDEFGEESLEELEEEFEDFDEFSGKKLKKAVGIEIEATFKSDGEKRNAEFYVVAYKYGAKWYFFACEPDYYPVTN